MFVKRINLFLASYGGRNLCLIFCFAFSHKLDKYGIYSVSSFLFLSSQHSSDLSTESATASGEAQPLWPITLLRTTLSSGRPVFRERPHLCRLHLWTLSSRSPWRRANLHGNRWEGSKCWWPEFIKGIFKKPNKLRVQTQKLLIKGPNFFRQ